jgi:hypothetical protein
MQKLFIALVAILVASPVFAAEQTIKLKPGPGLDKVEANCQACHPCLHPDELAVPKCGGVGRYSQ